jgi:hypothetical protein
MLKKTTPALVPLKAVYLQILKCSILIFLSFTLTLFILHLDVYCIVLIVYLVEYIYAVFPVGFHSRKDVPMSGSHPNLSEKSIFECFSLRVKALSHKMKFLLVSTFD